MSARRQRPNLVPGGIVAAAGFALLWSRLLPLTQSLWADEIHSIVAYINPGPAGIFSHYVANDHMLFELLTWAWTGAIGDHSQAAYRFWGVAPALAAGILLTWWLWRRLDPWVAAIFAVLAVASPLYYQLSVDARGYGLAFLGAALMLIGADGFVRSGRTRELGLFAAGAVIGIWTLPVFVLAFVATTGLLLARARRHTRRLLFAVGLVGLLSLLFYAPVLGGLLTASGQTYGSTLPWHGFASGPFRDLLAPEVVVLTQRISTSTFAAMGPGANGTVPGSGGWPGLLAAAVVLAGVRVAFAARERYLGLALLVPALFTYAVLDLGRFHTVDRFASFLLLGLLVLCALALVAVGRAIARLPRGRPAAIVLAVAFSLLALARTDSQLKLDLTAPYENDQAVADLVTGTRLRSVLTNSNGGDLYFYLGPRAFITPSRAQLEAVFCSGAGPFVYLQELFRSPSVSTACLRARGAISIPVAQRHADVTAAGSPFVAWLAPGGASAPGGAATTVTAGARPVSCRIRVRPAVYIGPSPSVSGEPVVVRLAAAGRSRLTLTVMRTVSVGSIAGAGAAAGKTFSTRHGFVAIEYELANRGPAAITPQRAVNRVAGLAGDFGGTVQPAGAFDPRCKLAPSSFAAIQRLADPAASVPPGRHVETVAVYPLPSPTPVTRYILAWNSVALRISVALPLLAP